MSIDRFLGNFFKPEIKVSGSKLFAQGKVSVPTGSDTSIHGYVKGTPPLKVSFSSVDVGAESFVAECSCPMAKKNQFCKHIWATLLFVEKKYPDFLNSKQIIKKSEPSLNNQSGRSEAFQESAKLRAADFRKKQYERQKQRAKDFKARGRKGEILEERQYSATVENTLAYFLKNGFPMQSGPSEAIALEARRKLSRLFHPDKGGTHEEMMELNQHCDVVLRFLKLR